MSFGDLKTIFQFDSFRDYYVVLALIFAMAFGFVIFCKARVHAKSLPPVWFLVLMGLAGAAGVAALAGIVVFFTNYDLPSILKVLLTIVYTGALCLCVCVGMLLGGFILQPIVNLYFKHTFRKDPVLRSEFVEPALRDKANKVFICGSYCEYAGNTDRVLHFHDFDRKDLNPLGQKLFTQVMRAELKSLGRYSMRPAESNGFYYMSEEEILKSHFFESGYELINTRYKRDEERREKIARKKGVLPQTDEVNEYMGEVAAAAEESILVDAKEGNLPEEMLAAFGAEEVLSAAMEPAPAPVPLETPSTVDKTPAALRLEQQAVLLPEVEVPAEEPAEPAPYVPTVLPIVPADGEVEEEAEDGPLPLLLQAEEAENMPETMAEPVPTLILSTEDPAEEPVADAAPVSDPVEEAPAAAAEEAPKAQPAAIPDPLETKKVVSLEEMIAAQIAKIEQQNK